MPRTSSFFQRQMRPYRVSDAGRVSIQHLPSGNSGAFAAVVPGGTEVVRRLLPTSQSGDAIVTGRRENWVPHESVEVDGYLTKATSSFDKFVVFVGRPSSLRLAGVQATGSSCSSHALLAHQGRGEMTVVVAWVAASCLRRGSVRVLVGAWRRVFVRALLSFSPSLRK